ncbi:hypothetical protein HMPREF9413_1620 [Paenibacillus sp. HGF7]|nr:hypothetical protein HMPREF9413_1620 [Paenibacillus sp. HGF7]
MNEYCFALFSFVLFCFIISYLYLFLNVYFYVCFSLSK